MSGKAPNTFSWLKGFLSQYRKAVTVALAFGLAASACAALLMFTSGYLISATALAATTLFSVLVPVACVQLFGFGRPLARYLERLASHNWVLKLTSDIRLALYRGIEQRAGDPARARATGEYLGLLDDDVAHLQNLYLRVVFPTVIAYFLAIGSALAFGFFSAPFALVMLLSLALVVVALPFGACVATRARTEWVKSRKSEAYVAVTDDVQGATDWLLSGRASDALARHESADRALRREDASVRMSKRVLTLASTLILGALVLAVLAWAGSSFGGADGPSVNWIAAFTLGFFPLIESFSMLPESLSDYTVHAHASNRLRDYLCTGPPSAFAHGEASPADGTIALANVSYTYPSASRKALDGIALEIPAGQSVAVLGRSGSGKSTLANLVCGTLRCDEGTIELGGIAVGDPSLDMPSAVGYLDQIPYLFNRSLRDNLTMGVNETPDDELAETLESVGLGDKLRSLPCGLDTVIGETGVGLSGGEAHRVALARVLVAHTPIVVVDEPFSALDPETERDLLDTLLSTCRNRTLLVITHHLAEIERFDRIVFIEDGSIALDGTPAELAAANEHFQSLIAFDRAGRADGRIGQVGDGMLERTAAK